MATKPQPAPRAEIEAVVKGVAAGDESLTPRLRELIEHDPARMVAVAGGDLAYQVEQTVVEKLSRMNLIWGVSVHPKLDQIRQELGGDDPSPIERLPVERAVGCWLDLYALEIRHANSSSVSIPQSDHWERVRDRANRRYLAALKSLAVVCKLGVMVVLANVDARGG